MTPTGAELPEQIGPYRPAGRLGEGGMGVVYRAFHVDAPSRMVALKVVRSGLAPSSDADRRFEREARILESLRHPNIVSLLEIGLYGTSRYVAMELLDGYPLSHVAGRPYTEIVPLLIQLSLGLEYLAARSIVHRDLSPGNVLVVTTGAQPVVKVLDFGIAKNLDARETIHDFTRTGVLVGKPAYWSPELLGMLEEGEELDWRSDVYSLGVIFYFLLAKRLPFKADSPFTYASAHLNVLPEPVDAAEGCPPLPESLAALVMKMLEKSRDDRPASYREILEVLASVLPEDRRPVLPPEPDRLGAQPGEGPSARTKRWRKRDLAEQAPPGAALEDLSGRAAVPAPPSSRRLLRVTAGGVALAAAITAVVVLRPGREGRVAPAPQPPILESSKEGLLTIQALPWARVVSVIEEGTGRRMPVPPDLTTPAMLRLPAGRWIVELEPPGEGKHRSPVVEVQAGSVQHHVEAFETPREARLRLD